MPSSPLAPPPASPLSLAEGVSRAYLLHHRVCPKERRPDGIIVVAVATEAMPGAVDDALDDLAFAYQAATIPEPATAGEIDRLIERITTRAERTIELARADASGDEDDLTADVRDLVRQPPVVRYVNLLVRDAYDARASDIHLEATRSGLSARFRVDGVLGPASEAPASLHHAVISRVKLLADLDIAERRRPQDGRIRVRLDAGELDLRVATVPTMHGESVVLRLLDRGDRPVALGDLGMAPDAFAGIERVIRRPHGLLLVTGPTGSGKTTTLYAALQTRDAEREKIITVEDPVEYELAGVTQVPVHRQAGVAFGTALRAILRQDPDVVMVGEMRDAETAEVAIQAAMTGHLVLSTLHTNDAIGAIPRLLDLGVPDFLAAATLEGVLAQRLVRKVCEGCRTPYEPRSETLRLIEAVADEGTSRFVHGTGCAQCRGTGFRGRIGVFELLLVADELRDAIARRAARADLRALAIRSGMVSLRTDGLLKARAGLTTVEEVLRVVQE